MPEPERNPTSLQPVGQAASPADATRGEGYCATCGSRANINGPAIERFGEPFCSEAHAEAFATEIRAARVQAAVARQVGERTAEAARRPGGNAYLGKAICWGLPVLAIVFLLGGGAQVLGMASAAVPFLAVLACPLAMYLMMRSMSRMGHPDSREDKSQDKP